MAPIGGRPFLELLLRQLHRHGFTRVILSVGYRHEVIREYFGESAFGMEIVYSIESYPLGTGGALRQADAFLRTDAVLVMNGDSYTNVDLGSLVTGHVGSEVDLTVAVIPDTRPDGGSVVLDGRSFVVAFAEKRPVSDSRYLNAGVYAVNRDLIGNIRASERISLEEQLFPEWLESGKRIKGFIFQGQCLDIGTPERYRQAQRLLANAELPARFESED